VQYKQVMKVGILALWSLRWRRVEMLCKSISFSLASGLACWR